MKKDIPSSGNVTYQSFCYYKSYWTDPTEHSTHFLMYCINSCDLCLGICAFWGNARVLQCSSVIHGSPGTDSISRQFRSIHLQEILGKGCNSDSQADQRWFSKVLCILKGICLKQNVILEIPQVTLTEQLSLHSVYKGV